MMTYRILSLDGGGIRGIISAILLERLEQACPGWLDSVDLFTGTSTGGLLALGLASGMRPTEMIQLYERLGPVVFSDTIFDDIHDLGKLLGAEYQLGPFKSELIKRFGNMTLNQLKKKVLISTFDLDNRALEGGRSWKAKFFHNFPGKDSDGDEHLVDVAIRTSAAPTYFPIYQGFIDGGVIANNPSVCAIAQALNPDFNNAHIEDLRLLSLGTGKNPKYIASQNGDWGIIEWAPYIVEIMLEGNNQLADYQCRQILNEKYLRINLLLPEPIGMDRIDRIATLKRVARQYDLNEKIKWLKRNFC
jgi:patatin-like phospholipase/acyl hydrolase